MTREDAELVIDVLAKNKQHFVDIMMVEELGIMPYDPTDNPAKDGTLNPLNTLITPIITV